MVSNMALSHFQHTLSAYGWQLTSSILVFVISSHSVPLMLDFPFAVIFCWLSQITLSDTEVLGCLVQRSERWRLSKYQTVSLQHCQLFLTSFILSYSSLIQLDNPEMHSIHILLHFPELSNTCPLLLPHLPWSETFKQSEAVKLSLWDCMLPNPQSLVSKMGNVIQEGIQNSCRGQVSDEDIMKQSITLQCVLFCTFFYNIFSSYLIILRSSNHHNYYSSNCFSWLGGMPVDVHTYATL